MNKQVANGRLRAAAATGLKLAKAEASVANPKAVDYYIFNAEKAYVVVAGDDLAPEILMYGEEGALDINNIPPAMQWLLNKYKYQIDGLKDGTLAPVKLPKFATTAIAPLVTANWDQSAPYYNQCPTSGSRRTLTGCPATSMSMNYYKWKWPETYPACAAIASSSYGVAAAALPERAADWDNMIDEYTGPTNTSYNTTQANAVAWLMRYAGQSMVNYMYGTSASGANDPDILVGAHNMGYTDAQLLTLTEYNGYSNGSQKYTDTQWNEWMMNELQNGRPIEYLAYDSKNSDHGGHAFNVFGCNSSGQYYVNWGWSGDSNGYCTLHNFTTATGATGGYGSYVFNWGEAMIIGIEPPAGALTNPRITVNPTSLTMNTTVGTPATATFTVTGANLTGNVTLTMSGDNAFSLSTTSISASQAENGVTVTVTYNPNAVGTHEATVTLASTDAESVTVKLNGTADPTPLETYAPVMLDATNITSTSFTASWTDATPAANVVSYTLYVSSKPIQPETKLLESTDWTSSNTVPSGWTAVGLNYYSSNSACYLSASANGYVQTKTYDLTGYDKVTVRVYSEPYGNSNTMTVATSADSETQTLSGSSFGWYTFVLDCATSDYVKLTTTGMPDMKYMEVYAGDLTATQLKASETGDDTYRVITGITSKSYTVQNLTEGGTFNFYVVANYTNTTIGTSNTKQVTLLENTNPTLAVNPATVEMTATVGETATATFNVSGANLNGDVTLALTDANGVFSISPTTISAAEAMTGKDVTVTYAPTTFGSQTATISLNSDDAENMTVTLNGTATLAKSAPVMAAADDNFIKHTSFRADWADATPEANVASYTLEVTPKSTEPENPDPELTVLAEFNMDNLTAVTDDDGYLTNVSSSYASYLPEGWTVGSPLYVGTGYILVREQTSSYLSNCLTTPSFTLPEGCDKVTVVVTAAGYDNNSITTGLTASTVNGGSSQTATFDELSTWYNCVYVLDASSTDQVRFNPYTTSSEYYAYAYIGDIKIYAGDVSDQLTNSEMNLKTVSESGDSTSRVVEGITDKYYVVKDLTAGGTFLYRVKALYVDETESEWSNIETVTLRAEEDPDEGLRGDVNLDGRVDVDDVNIVIAIILGKDQAENYDRRAYITDDDNIDVDDVNELIRIILGKATVTYSKTKKMGQLSGNMAINPKEIAKK